MTILFDQISRRDVRPARYAESNFSYLNTSARRSVVTLRTELETWFAKYPSEHRPGLLGRFRSVDDTQHCGAFFELFLHEFLRRLGCQVDVHPALPHTSNRPEFRVTSSTGVSFYLEATVANDRTKTQATAEKRLNKIYDALNDFDSPHFWIGAEIEAAPNHDVPLKLLKAFLRSRLAQLDPVLWNCEVPLQEMPRWRYEHGDWRGTFFPIPTGRGVGKDLSRSLGIQVSPLSPIYPAKSVRSSILQKAKHYGNPDLPFVIAVNALGNFMSERHILDALFGEVFVSRFEGDEFRMKRKRNGVWTRPAGIYTRVSAVLVCQRLNAWNFPSAKACLYHHPAPAKPLTNALAALPHVTVQNQWLCIEPGQSIGDIFGIPSEWLGDLQ